MLAQRGYCSVSIDFFLVLVSIETRRYESASLSEVFVYALLPLAGFVAGIVNTIAGGGSFLTLPCLMLLGLPEQLANGTNRIAIAMQSLYSVRVYHQHRPIEWRALPALLGPSLPGLAVGAALATELSPAAFRGAMGVLFLAFVAVMLVRPRLLLESAERERPRSRWLEVAAFFAIGMYAGFLQAGVGVLLLLALSTLQSRELVDANGIKLAIIAVWIVPTVIFFAARGQVEWLPGVMVGIGNFFGARVGAKLAVKKGNKLIFGFVVAVMVATGISLLVR